MADHSADRASQREFRDLAERYAQARRLTVRDVSVVDHVNRLIELGGDAAYHIDVPHWDSGHADGGFHDGHYDLHGDIPHWDHGDEGHSDDHADDGHGDEHSDDGHADEGHGDDGDLLRDPFAILIAEQRYALEWSRQMSTRFEQRLSALAKLVAEQTRRGER